MYYQKLLFGTFKRFLNYINASSSDKITLTTGSSNVPQNRYFFSSNPSLMIPLALEWPSCTRASPILSWPSSSNPIGSWCGWWCLDRRGSFVWTLQVRTCSPCSSTDAWTSKVFRIYGMPWLQYECAVIWKRNVRHIIERAVQIYHMYEDKKVNIRHILGITIRNNRNDRLIILGDLNGRVWRNGKNRSVWKNY